MNKEVVVTSNEVTGKLKTQSNPLLQPWTGDFGGYPAFDKVKLGDFLPAIEIAITEAKKEIDKIATNKEHPTFDNTLLALEKSGQMLNRVVAIYWIWSSTMSTPEFQKIEQIVEPKLTAFDDWVTQNPQLFQRIKAIYTGPGYKQLSHEAQRLVKIKYDNLVRNGANLNDAQKAELSKYNQELSSLYTQFSQNLLADESEKTVVVMSLNELDGLSQSLVDAASQAAEDVGMEGKFVIKNTRSSVDPVLTYANNRDLRERVWRMFTGRGDNGDKNDNNEVIVKILSLRSKKAKLLGFKTHAHWRLENSMAKVPENAMKLMLDVWEPAKKKVQEEVADMQAYADMAGDKITIEPWDYKFYAEKVRKEKYDLDQNEVKEYLQLDKLKEGMFWVAGQIFNLSFDKLQGIPTCHADVEVWEVKNRITGKHVGLWYFDPYARNGKRSGAWMNAYREQQRVTGDIPTIVSNNSNFVKGREGEAVLISRDDASTLFHEFGHALHGLLSNVTYPSLSGTNVYTDYVEFPSQLLEFWLATPEVLQNFALHYRSGKPIPQDLVNKIQKASTFNEGFATTEYLASALIDMELHLAEIPTTDPDQFEKVELSKLGMPKEIVMRHRTPQFGHIFSSDQYSAGYYSYLWADVLTADGYQAFLEGKGPYDTDIAKRLIANVFSVGNTIDPEEGYRKFRGRDPQVAALMRKRGLQ
ncbi:MAG: M3 family metallopeptidase [Saprospiraceae bacterium]|nr:M3 family metallopeptidase [Saprospiraceae bacterium]MCB0592008.1 M3 family metallopeptidase [Saprospiraceae bacterium]MCO5284617.1 M3 family metallopeptidase [Saprospiraceae bacterium]MCO6471775.1 M3 family metallopeptidase [Saprospiraceae bacterium]HMY83931.1 M3 family metallopeptidase [Saprospiraceae bacterium]